MKLGVFDSGIGGEAIAASLRTAFPEAEIEIVNDRKNVPYGSKSPGQIIALTDTAIQPLLALGCDIIVLACNSASAAAIETLRATYPEQKFIGLEPMVKPAAAMSKSKIIAVCATPATLASNRYQRLKQTYATNIAVLEPDCSDWAHMIEHDRIDPLIVRHTIEDVCDQGADVVVLGCTHYHWIKELIEETTRGRAAVIDPSDAIARRVAQLLEL